MLNIHEYFGLCLFSWIIFTLVCQKIQFLSSFETLRPIIYKATFSTRLFAILTIFRSTFQSKKIHLCHQLLIISAILHRRYFQRFLSPRGSWEENNITFLHKHHPSNARNCNEKVIQSNLTSKHDESEREGKQSIETTLLPFTDIVWCLFLSDKVSPFHVCIVFSCKWFIPSKW